MKTFRFFSQRMVFFIPGSNEKVKRTEFSTVFVLDASECNFGLTMTILDLNDAPKQFLMTLLMSFTSAVATVKCENEFHTAKSCPAMAILFPHRIICIRTSSHVSAILPFPKCARSHASLAAAQCAHLTTPIIWPFVCLGSLRQ